MKAGCGVVLSGRSELVKNMNTMDAGQLERFTKGVNILGDTVQTETPFLARRALENTKNGAKIEWLTKGKAAWRFITAPFRKRDLPEAESFHMDKFLGGTLS